MTLACILCSHPAFARDIWAHDNLVAWEMAANDSTQRGPEERAQMLERLGFKHYAYLSSGDPWDSKNDVNVSQLDVDAEIEAMQRHGIDILAWYFWINTDDPAEVPKVRATLESFERHQIHPQIWVTHSFAYRPRTSRQWAKFLPKGSVFPETHEEYERLSQAEQRALRRAVFQALRRIEADNFPKTPGEQRQRVRREAERIHALAKLAAPYGCTVNLYNHRGWFGMMENELAILERLKAMGVSGVGLVYNFSHSHDEFQFHDDSKRFRELWAKIQSRVVAVNIAGLAPGLIFATYPSQGNRELEMMRTIEDSGWQGPVGVLTHKVGDAEVMLRNALVGVDWLAAELKQPGSAGPRPVLETIEEDLNP